VALFVCWGNQVQQQQLINSSCFGVFVFVFVFVFVLFFKLLLREELLTARKRTMANMSNLDRSVVLTIR